MSNLEKRQEEVKLLPNASLVEKDAAYFNKDADQSDSKEVVWHIDCWSSSRFWPSTYSINVNGNEDKFSHILLTVAESDDLV